MTSKTTVQNKDGTVVTVTTTDKSEVVRKDYDPENDMAKSHEEIVEKIADVDLEIEELIQNQE